MFKKRNSRKRRNLKLCTKCKKIYTTEKDGICITCKANDWLKIDKGK